MTDTTPPENLELRHRHISNSDKQKEILDKTLPSSKPLDHDRKSTSSDPLPSATPGDITSFRSLIATNTASGNIKLSSPSSPDTTLFYVTNGSLRRNTPSVIVRHATDKGPVLATLKLGWGRDNTFGLGDPDKDGDIAWENLRRTSEWKHSTYEFEFGDDGDLGGRRGYVWQRTKQGFFSDQPNMELRQKDVSGNVGEVLAVYTGNQGMMLKSRGQFWLSPTLHRESKPSWEGANDGSWSELELIALVSGLGIIEGSRRRHRARRSGAGGAGGGSG